MLLIITSTDDVLFSGKKVKVKVVSLYSASSCTTYAANALFVTNQSRRSHSRRVQPANTGWRAGRPGNAVRCTKVPTFRNPLEGWQAELALLVD